MGILDDAIREHLDLKRRLGAEDEEIHKLESEAFGPPSRPDDPDFADTTAAEESVEDVEASAEADELVAGTAPPPTAEEPRPPDTAAEPAVETPLFDHSRDEPEAAAAPEPTPTEPEPEPEPEPTIESFDTVEHDFEGVIEETGEAEVVEGELEPEPAGTGEEDVLEETPEFLRDQPEDDELWFEQGEPKDFDF